jgi:hypothetical protein
MFWDTNLIPFPQNGIFVQIYLTFKYHVSTADGPMQSVLQSVRPGTSDIVVGFSEPFKAQSYLLRTIGFNIWKLFFNT